MKKMFSVLVVIMIIASASVYGFAAQNNDPLQAKELRKAVSVVRHQSWKKVSEVCCYYGKMIEIKTDVGGYKVQVVSAIHNRYHRHLMAITNMTTGDQYFLTRSASGDVKIVSLTVPDLKPGNPVYATLAAIVQKLPTYL